jgi:glycosyltransferase involved in cell wall biosynthesis
MRVLVFTDEYDLSYFTFIYNETKWLQAYGVEVFIVCERIGKLEPNDKNFTCIPLMDNKLLRKIYLQASKREWNRFLLVFFGYFSKRNKIIKDFKPDIIHIHFGDTATRLFFPLIKTISRYPIIISFHGFDASLLLNNTQYLGRIQRLVCYPNINGIYVSKKLLTNLLKHNVNLNKEKFHLLHYGVDLSLFQRKSRPVNTPKIILQISGFYEKKGHIYTIQAFKKYITKYPGTAILILGGDGPIHQEIKQEAIRLNLGDNVQFPGWISRKEAPSLLEKADVFVHHSVVSSKGDQEGMPNAIIEAMAMELPILATFHSGIPELVQDGINGLLVKERDVDEYANKLEQIIFWGRQPQNRDRVIEYFSIESHTQNLINIYQSILEKSKMDSKESLN